MKRHSFALCSSSTWKHKLSSFTPSSAISLLYIRRSFYPLPPTTLHAKYYTNQALHVPDGGLAVPTGGGLRPLSGLPWTCPGCGAYSHTNCANEAGYYSLARNQVATYVSGKQAPIERQRDSEQEALSDILENASQKVLRDAQVSRLSVDAATNPPNTPPAPLCDRCHTLIHNHQGQSAKQPTLQTVGDLLMGSPFKQNHIYQVLDAADFPLSLIPQLQPLFGLTPQRSRNRRSRGMIYRQDRKFDTSFVIARSDLLAPRKEQVDAMMPVLVEILRDALNIEGDRFRLGNVYCVSSKRGWWTKRLKDDVWSRGGGGWMLGKVNVGKSSLFDAAFPKGSHQGSAGTSSLVSSNTPARQIQREHLDILASTGAGNLLPPAPRFEPFPVMPIVSTLPGTTASPVRLPFGNGKGELIDLPGVARESLDETISEEAKASLVMTSRIKARQYTIKPGQSLVVSNIVRITPEFEDLVLLACPFLPLSCHVTSTEKAKAILAQENSTAVDGIAKPGVGSLIASAGVYQLKWDVTKNRTGPLTAPDAARLRPQTLPFIVYSLDLLLQGVGWIELAVQVRKRHFEGEIAENRSFPSIEVFSPSGKFIGSRRPLNAWACGGSKRKPVSKRTSRPRQSKKGEKKRLKAERRLFDTGG